jgi:hypothetical protein
MPESKVDMIQIIRNPLDWENSLSKEKENLLETDTIKIKFPTNVVKTYDERVFKQVPRFDRISCEQVSTKHVIPQSILANCTGLNLLYAEIDQVIMEFSSKINVNRDGIPLNSKDNIEKVFEKIRNLNFLDFDPQQLYEQAQVLKVDITKDVIMNENLQDYFSALNLLTPTVSDKYEVENFKNGICFTSKRKNNKDRIIGYSKYDELIKPSNQINQNILAVLSEEALNNFKPVVRFERNLTSFGGIRGALDIKDEKIMLKSVLESRSNPIGDMLSGLSSWLKDS